MIYSEELGIYISTEDAILMQLEGNKAIMRDVNNFHEAELLN